MTYGHPASGPPVDPANMRVPTGPAPGARMGPISQEELRRAAYYVTEALALGHQCDDGLAERIARLADTLARTNGWTPGDPK